MGFMFKKKKIISELGLMYKQNNDLEGGERALILNMSAYYDGLTLDSPEQTSGRWKRTPKYILYLIIVWNFVSSIYKKPPKYDLPLTDEELENIDLLGNSVDEYTAQIPFQVLKQGSCATIVDYSESLKKPYLLFIKPEQFVSFQTQNDKGYPELSQFIYHVTEEVQDPDDEFNLVLSIVHYVWDIFEGRVRVRKYKRVRTEVDQSVFDRINANRGEYEQTDVLVSENFLVANGSDLESLPIVIHGREANNYSVEKSVLQDVSDLNIHLINRVVDQVEVLHLTAMPTPYILGADPHDPDIPKTIGSSKLWVLSDPDAKVGLMEFTGKSAQAHRDYIEDLIHMMAVSGAQILRRGGVSRETATSVLIRTEQETAVITSIVQNISAQIEQVLKIYTSWLGKSADDVSYELNSDFVSVDMDPNAQIALVRSWLDGAISHQSMFKKMKEGELIASDKSFEDEVADIESNPPPFLQQENQAELDVKVAAADAKINQDMGGGGGSAVNPNSDVNARPKSVGSNLETGNRIKNTEA